MRKRTLLAGALLVLLTFVTLAFMFDRYMIENNSWTGGWQGEYLLFVGYVAGAMTANIINWYRNS